MNKTVISGAIAALLAGPAMAQTATLDQVSREIAEIKAKNERLEAEVEYLKENAKVARKENAVEAVEVANIKTATSKFTWSGDFRYRNEQIESTTSTTIEEQTRGRDRIRLRFGVTAKINDTVTGRFQLATAGGATGDPRSTNQTLGEEWTRKSVGIDLAYVDWKPISSMNLQLGKMPQPWTKTASYFWDGDITPEGAALKYTGSNLFAGAYYDWLNERYNNSSTNQVSSDSKLLGGQIGWKQPIGKALLTVATGYFDVTNVQDEVTSSTPLSGTPATACAANPAFFAQTSSAPNVATNFNTNANGNSVYDNNGATASGCSALRSDFGMVNALAQVDLTVGSFPMSVYVDYMQNLDAEINPVVGKKLDTAYAGGVTFNKASAPKSWEVSVVYQQTQADAVFGQFHDSDFAEGRTDSKGYVIKGAFAPAANWTIAGTLFLNKVNNDIVTPTTGNLDYTRLQLDLNFKF